MEYIIDDKNNSESFYFNNNCDEESENIIKSYEENSFQKEIITKLISTKTKKKINNIKKYKIKYFQ